METIEEKQKLIHYLTEFITPKRQARFNEVMANRMNYLHIVVEDVHQAHNASAVIRSCDCFGVQYVHFIEGKNKMEVNKDIALGAEGWVSIISHTGEQNNTRSCLRSLKQKGFRIAATSPHKNDFTIDQLPINMKLALVFGTEKEGISQEVKDEADMFVKIPMYGFTESFNISVSAALCMNELTTRIRKQIPDYHLTAIEKADVYLEWLKNSIDKSDAIIQKYLKKNKV